MIPSDPLFHKPKTIVAAKNILHATIFLGVINWVVVKLKFGFTDYTNATGIIITLLILLVIFILAKQIGLGMKWARTLYTVLCIAGMILLCCILVALLKSNIVLATLFLIEAILQILALKFLFSQDSTLWFNRVRSTIQDSPK